VNAGVTGHPGSGDRRGRPRRLALVITLTLTGVTLSQAADGTWQLLDSSGAAVATLGMPGAQDSNVDPRTGEPVTTSQVSYSLATVNGVEELTMTLDASWLADSARVFPVTVDPTVSINGQKLSTYTDKANLDQVLLDAGREVTVTVVRAWNEIFKDKQISEDDEKHALAEIQKLTDDYVHKLEEVAKKKEQEILTV